MSDLIAEDLFSDPEIKKAKEILLNTIQKYKNKITKTEKAKDSLAKTFKSDLEKFATLRGGNLYYPYIGSGIGNGALVELTDGSIKYDFITGIGVHYFGHSHEEIISASIDAALQDTVMQGHLQQNKDSMELMEIILKGANKNAKEFDHCFISTTGAQANENALKIIFQKKSPANRILCFENCFAGRTLALAQLTDKAAYRDGLPPTIATDYLPYYDKSNHQGSIDKTLKVLTSHLTRHKNRYAGMCFELIQGEGGYTPGNEEFFKAIIKVLKENNIAVWVDEVQTIGRTTELFAFQHFHLENEIDVLTLGKMAQVCATLYSDDFKPRPGLISQTFTSSTSAIKSSIRLFQLLQEENIFGEKGKIIQVHNHFVDHFKKLNKKYPNDFTGPYGLGAMIAFTSFDGDLAKSKEFASKLFENGLIGFIAGHDPVRIRFLLPILSVTLEDIDKAVEIIEKTYLELK
ncbi:MAG: acetylornithine aminotransferase [Planctomycetota bacterium]|nr:MAG: acetylornithine aminotransferase [Planctomycetota bacterium]